MFLRRSYADKARSSETPSQSRIFRLHFGDTLAVDPDIARRSRSSPATIRNNVDFPQPDGPPSR